MDLVEETGRKAEGRRQKAEALAWSLRRSASLGASTQYAYQMPSLEKQQSKGGRQN